MSIESVRAYFKGLGLDGKILEFPVSSATVDLAAKALGCVAGRIAKTLSSNVSCQGQNAHSARGLGFYRTRGWRCLSFCHTRGGKNIS